jgi:RimJ/RimL family protein N-acetyltransferase
MFVDFDGEVIDAGDHLVVRSPASPGYYWGNFLLYDRAATDADFGPWMQRFADTIVRQAPATGHVAFGMDLLDGPFSAPAAFLEAGFTCDEQATLTLGSADLVPPPVHPGPGFELRPLRLPDEAALVVDLDMACNDDGFGPAGYRRFRQAQMRRYGAMEAAGLGHWWGVLHEGRVVSSLGLFGRDGFGRFQHVQTHPSMRRRGLCRALVHAACVHGLHTRGWHTLVMGADPHDVAIGLYRSVGFRQVDTLWLLERRAPEDRAA